MDPLSISASIAGLVAVADLVFRYSTKYLNGARKEAEDISHEVKNLSVILHNLSLVAFELEETQSSDGTQQTPNLKPHHLHDCQQLLRRLEQGLVSTRPNLSATSRIGRLQNRLAWPFSSTDTKEILRDVRRHRQTIELALEADSLSNLRLLLSRQSDANSKINHIQETVNKICDIQISIRLDEKRKKVLEFFAKANPHSELDTNRNLRYSLTGLWLTEGSEFEEWYTTPGSKIWCSGIPGAGKSVLAAAMIDECLQRNAANPFSATAYFFCIYRDEKTQDPVSILSSLCSQLAQQDEKAFLVLEEYYDELTSERQLQSGPSTKKLIKVLRRMCSLIDRVYIIVDGLDECGKRVEETVESLAALIPSHIDEGLNIALLSRNEVPIREILGDEFQNIEIEAHTEDIQLYVASELKQRIESKKLRLRDLALKDVIMTRLVEGAQGMFRWVACQLDHLCELPTDRDRRKALDKLPPTLFTTYEQILTRINNSGEENKQLVQKTLLLTSFSHHGRLNLRQICEAISLQDGDEEFVDEDIIDGEEVLRLCGSLIRIRKSSYYTKDDGEVGIEFSHFSVQEYLQDECLRHATLSAYGVSQQKACQLLASLSLGYLTLKNEEQLPETAAETIEAMCERDLRHPFYRHAATHWLSYVHEAGEGCCLERIHDLFQVHKTPNFCTWAITLAAHSVLVAHPMMSFDGTWNPTRSFRGICMPFHPSHLVQPDFTPLHMAAILGIPDLCRHLLSQGADLDSKGKFGTPLHCAIAGLVIFTFEGDFPLSYFMRRLTEQYGMDQPLGRLQAAQVLLEAGANTQLLCTGYWEGAFSSLSFSALTSSFGPELEIAAELIKTGTNVEEEDLAWFIQCYEEIQYREYQLPKVNSQAVLKLLEALGPSGTHTKTTPKALLYNKTLNWAAGMKIAPLGAMSTYQPMSDASDDEIFDFIFSWVQRNDAIELNRFLKGTRSELVTSARFDVQRLQYHDFLNEVFTYQDSTALHLAAYHNSLAALDTLIDHGFDANIAAPDGKRPVHLCCHQDALRALLRHGASTLVSDNTQETIWHTAANYGQITILELLVQLDVRQEALQMVSLRKETPICTALNRGRQDAVLFLLKYCNSREFWKSGESIFRAAAKMGSSEIVKHLLDVGIEVDGMDDVTGSPLHYLSTTATVECIALLKSLFPLEERRKEDHRTPLESLLLRATGESTGLEGKVLRATRKSTVLEGKVLEAMLPGNALSCPHEASSLWSFVGSEVAKSALISPECSSSTWTWLTDFVFALIELGIMVKYEATGQSALRPFASFLPEALKLPGYPQWHDFSRMVLGVAREARRWDIAVSEPEVVRLLTFSILHDDIKMISLLVDKGVDIHSRADVLSPFEFACFPGVPVSERSFAILLEHATLEKMTERNENFDGCGSLHFTAACNGRECTWKLRQMLSAGVNPCSPLSPSRGSPLAHHLSNGALNTAEILLESGADPWARGSYPFDAPLEAARCGSHSILKKIAAFDHESPCWDRTWPEIGDEQGFSGGNALHLAAMNGKTGCLEFYLNQGLLSDLECRDDKFETPMHYAARFDHFSTIKWLKARGGGIDARNRDGLTPLHLAVAEGHLETVKTLIRLGVKHQVCNQGCVPLVYAYFTENASMIETLQSSSGEFQEWNSPNKSPIALEVLAQAMRNAILRGDVPDCEKVLALGCPVDVELYDEVPVTPLAVAICHQQDPKVVEFLVDTGATVSTIFPQLYQDRYLTALEAAVAQPMFNSLLHKLLNIFLEEGGNFLDMARSPLRLAVDYNNIEGLRILLDWLRETYGSSEPNPNRSSRVVENKSSQSGTMSAFIDQKYAQDQETALHVAASENNIDACAILVSSLANIEETNIRNETPLHLAAEHGSLQVAKHLLDCGAHPNPLDAWDETPLMCAYRESQWELVDLLMPYCKDITTTNILGENVLHFMARFEPDTTRPGSSLKTLSRCIEQGASLHLPNSDGVAPVHWILAKQSAYHLRFLLNIDHRCLRPQETARWPDCWFFAGNRRLAAISKNLRLVQPFLSNSELRQLCAIAERGDHSLLCRAACWGSVESIESLLALGVGMIEHQCKDHGTPLAAAISRGHIKAVKCLVSNGAAVPYGLCQPNDFEVSVGKPDFVIQQWLFVGRHVEQNRISDVMAEASDKIESWAGVRTARVALKWEWKRHRGEDIWEYACRRQKILKDVRGKVVKCLEETTEGENASSDASDEKFSGRHYCLGRGRIRGAMLVY